MYTGTLDKIKTSAVFEIALVRDERLFTRTSKQSIMALISKWKVTTIFYLPLKLQQSAPQLMTHTTNTSKITPKWYIITTVFPQSLDWSSYFVAEHFDVVSAEARLCSILDYLLWLLCFSVTSNSRIRQLKEQVNHIKEIIDLLLFYILNAAQW